ncbi:MAG TPA: MFS transporter [Acidisarcina sp.]
MCGVFAFIGLYATQPLLPLFARLFHASKAEVGLTVSATTLGVALSAPFVASFAERLSRKRVIVCSVLALAVPTLLAATAGSLHALVFWRFLQGVVTPGIFATTIAYITEQWSRKSTSLVMSIYVSGTALGGFCGRIISGLAAHYLDWHWSFLLLGLMVLAGAAAVQRWLPKERQAALPASGSEEEPQGENSARVQLQQAGAHLRNPRLMAAYAVGFNVLFSLVAIFTYITYYLSEPPFNLSTVALSYLFVVYLVGLAVTPAAGWVIGRIGLRRGLLCSVLLSLAGVLTTLAHSLPVVVLGLALVCSGTFISQATATSFLRDAASEGARVSAVGLYISCYYFGGTAAGVVPSYFWHLGKWPACVAFISLLQISTMLIAWKGWRGTGFSNMSAGVV